MRDKKDKDEGVKEIITRRDCRRDESQKTACSQREEEVHCECPVQEHGDSSLSLIDEQVHSTDSSLTELVHRPIKHCHVSGCGATPSSWEREDSAAVFRRDDHSGYWGPEGISLESLEEAHSSGLPK